MDLYSYNIKIKEGALEISAFNLYFFSKQKEINSLSKDNQVVSGRSKAIIFENGLWLSMRISSYPLQFVNHSVGFERPY